MIRINLLPVRQMKRRQKAVNEFLIFTLSVAVVLLGIGVAGGVIAHTKSSLNKDIQQLQVKKNSYAPILKQIADLKKKKKNLEAKIDTIKKLKKGSQVTVRILDEIADRTPPNRIWLKSLQQKGAGMKLAGVALDNATIAQYMIALAASPNFTAANLQSSKQTVVEGSKLKDFSLNVGIKQATPETTAENPNQQPGMKN
jgi:type IV pilus assembly protein PilN